MTAYTTISNALVAVGAKPFATTVQAFRDNPLAIAECDSTAPINASAWHPYNKVTVGDSNTGEIWSTATNGAVATITTPDFADGWEYAMLINGIITSTPGGSPNVNLNCYRATTGAYAGATSLGNTASDAFPYFAWLEFSRPRQTRRQHSVVGFGQTTASGANNVQGSASRLAQTVNHATAEKLLRAQLSLATGNIQGTGAAVYLYRRKDIA